VKVDPIDKIVFSDFYDMIRKPKPRSPKKCLRCGASTITDRTCNKCAKVIRKAPRLMQEGDFRIDREA